MDLQKVDRAVETKIKHVFKTALRCIEIKFGDEFEGYEQMRSEILRVGNNAIREIRELMTDESGENLINKKTEVRIRRG